MNLNQMLLILFVWTLGLGGVLAAPLQLKGHLVQGGLVYGKTNPGAKVQVDGRSVRVSKEGIFLIGFGRDASSQTELTVDLADGTRMWQPLTIAQRDYDVQHITGLPPRKVNPTEQDMKRIRAEIAVIEKTRQLDDSRTDFQRRVVPHQCLLDSFLIKHEGAK